MSALENGGWLGPPGDMSGIESLRAESARDIIEVRPPLRPPRTLLPPRDLLLLTA